MPLDALFRLSTYLSLGMATLCLATAEEPLLPGMIYSSIPVGLLLVLAYWVEGRWSLSLTASNYVGFLIACVSGAWIIHQVFYSPPPWAESVGYPAASLPFAGPVLMLLMVAKLFRTKETADFWSLHLVGLLQVALACVLAAEPLFALLLAGYLVCSSCSLSLFYHYRGQLGAHGREEAEKGASASPESGGKPSVRWRGWAFGLEGVRALLLAVLGLGFFLLTPRWSNTQWQLTAIAEGLPLSPGEVGFSRRIDLNHTGPLKVNDKIAFKVTATDTQGAPKTDLPPEQRWRGVTLDEYRRGRWGSGKTDPEPEPGSSSPSVVQEGTKDDLAGWGPSQYYVTFSLNLREVAGLFLADPVTLPDRGFRNPVVRMGNSSQQVWFHVRDRTLVRIPHQSARDYRYMQVNRRVGGTELIPAVKLSPPYLHRLLDQPVDSLRPWTAKLLKSLVRKGKLRQSAWTDNDEASGGLPPQRRTAVARALTDYLASSGEYHYSLELQRKDLSLDPAEDFLVNVKQGHCEYYATALALMLRSVSIPARIVNGYRGAESPEGQPKGYYVVRESHAHAWVEALIGDGQGSYWLTLDPTPVSLATSSSGSFSWSDLWDTTANSIRTVWRSVFIETQRNPVYDEMGDLATAALSEERLEGAASWFRQALAQSRLWVVAALAGVGVIASWLIIRRARRRLRAERNHGSIASTSAEMILYQRWLGLASHKFGLVPASSQTPLEFADVVSQALEARPFVSQWADLPRSLVRLFYRARYGGHPLSPAEHDALENRLNDVARAKVEG
jgi:protein-glutamine gamma-glutamyltransferase